MKIDGADFKSGMLMLKTSDPDALRFARTFKEPGEYEISKSKKKRSMDANKYFWEIVGKLSAAMCIDKDTIYRSAVCAVGAFTTLEIPNDAFDDFRRVWANKGLSWIAEKVDEKDNGNAIVRAYYGSSAYDAKEMSALIDYVLQDARAIGIETLDDQRISALLEEWDAGQRV